MNLADAELAHDNVHPSMRSIMRQATHAAHERLHHHAGFAALLRGELSRPDYVRLLLRLLGLHAPIESRLAPFRHAEWLAWHAADGSAARSLRLCQDLRALGVPEADIKAAPTAEALLPALETEAAALGCAWVVEGSALGGRVIAQHVAALLGPGLGGGSFFHADAAQPARWRACCAALDACGGDATRRAAMLAAANATFGAVEVWLGNTEGMLP